MNPFTAFTLSGPAIGGLGWYFELPWIFWTGVALAAINLSLNLGSGVLRLPVLPAAAIILGMMLTDPWLTGAAIGLLVYTVIEGVGDLYADRQVRR